MKLKTVAIHNFRGIHDATLKIHDFTLLIGSNNSGKSTVIDAIRAFYEKDGFKFKPERDLPKIPGADDKSWVEISFELNASEHASLAQDYKQADMELRLRKIFRSGDGSGDGQIFGYRSDGVMSPTPFYGARNVQSGKIGDLVYIPAVSKIDEHTKLSGPSALRDLLTDVLDSIVTSSPSYQQFSTAIGAFAEAIKAETTDSGQSLAGLEQELSESLSAWDTSFRLDMKSPSMPEIVKTLITHQCVDLSHGEALSADQFGSGFQRYLIYKLIEINARRESTRTPSNSTEFIPSLKLVLFEEPEAFLHPPQQDLLARNLKRLSESGDQQVVCSTHSPHFVSRNSSRLPEIARLRREKGRIDIFQIDEVAWKQIVDGNQEINDLEHLASNVDEDDREHAMEDVKYFLWLNPDRCGAFFANHVLLVEGATEQAFISKLIDDGKIESPPSGVHVLDSMGKFNIHRFMNLLQQLGVSHSVLNDDDDREPMHESVNELIRNSRGSLTHSIVELQGDIERFMGVPKPRNPRRKPQHLLLKYEARKIDDGKLRDFCSRVQSCLSRTDGN
jgi:hypothetical protein